ncbi:hypothetical protein MG293_019278 [Ovis ammon polii]|uniref:Uncharacterized protein n=1 Tax=Ovis ammon polii TaxID=230172 RepID=A0AAD4TQF0_OVIAM|nr:hypothetical protein MG293_019278 [Ovis ammon polii]
MKASDKSNSDNKCNPIPAIVDVSVAPLQLKRVESNPVKAQPGAVLKARCSSFHEPRTRFSNPLLAECCFSLCPGSAAGTHVPTVGQDLRSLTDHSTCRSPHEEDASPLPGGTEAAVLAGG